MDENEKEWISSRIDTKHVNYLEELSVLEDRLDRKASEIDRRIRNGRSYLLTVVGVILSILLGLLSSNIISIFGFYFYISIDFACGFTIFIITNKISYVFSSLYGVLSQTCVDAQSNISTSRNYFTSSTLDLQYVNKENLLEYSTFTEILLNASLVPLFLALNLSLTNKYLRPIDKKSIKNEIDILKKQLDISYSMRDTIENTISPVDLKNYIKEQFAEYENFLHHS